MTHYSLIFTSALTLNVIVTFRSSRLWNNYKHNIYNLFSSTPVSPPPSPSSSLSDSDALLHKEATENDDTPTMQQQKIIHASLLRRYLIVYLLATLSDWLQGPYVYALYDTYGYPKSKIAVLFVAGFGSSMIFGSFIGGMADMCGRKKFVLIFALVYGGSCLTKHVRDLGVLMVGRLLGGIATSLLFSVFDSWLIRSHADCRLDKSFLSSSFATASYGNSIMAICAGLVADWAADPDGLTPIFGDESHGEKGKLVPGVKLYWGGFVNPFDIALLALVLCGFVAAFTWEENYGDSNSSDISKSGECKEHKWYGGLRSAFNATTTNVDILLCGLVSSLFEGSMYVFVFMWTPALTGKNSHGDDDGAEGAAVPFGLVFSTFMVCCMAGSSTFSISIEYIKGEALAVLVFAISSFSMFVIAFSSSLISTSTLPTTITFLSMLLFEMCVGMYWPIMGTMKGAIVPEDKRSAIYNLFRIPLNFIVLTSLLTDLSPTESFYANSFMLGLATILQMKLMKRRIRGGILVESDVQNTSGGNDNV